jgi:hypothetical protein
LVNRVGQKGGLVRPPGGAFEVHAEGEPGVARQLARPFDDEFLCPWIEVPLTEW